MAGAWRWSLSLGRRGRLVSRSEPPPGGVPAGAGAWPEVRALLGRHRTALAVGLGLVVVNRLATLVLPVATRYVIDDVIGHHRLALLPPIVLASVGAIALECGTTFGVAQVMSIAGQRAIVELRRTMQEHLLRLPITYFETTQTGT